MEAFIWAVLGGAAASLAQNCIKNVETIESVKILGMEALGKLKVRIFISSCKKIFHLSFY